MGEQEGEGDGGRLVPVGFLHVSVNIRARLKIEQCFSDQVIFPELIWETPSPVFLVLR